MMRILHLTSHLNVGGITRYVVSLSKELTERGHRVVVASGGGALESELEASGAAYWPVPLHTSVEFSPPVVRATGMLATQLEREPVDILHGHTRVGQVVAARLARRFRIPWVTTWHGFFRPNLGRWLWPCLGDVTIAISEPVRQHLMESFCVPSERIRLIPHGIDPTPFTTPVEASAKERLRHAAGVPTGARIIGTVARLVPSKGTDQLIHAFTEVRRLMPETHLLIVGDGTEREALAQLAASHGIGDSVHFVGTLPETRVALSLMDVFVFVPAEREGFGLSLLEAMASGRPVVAVRRGHGAAWVLEESEAGPLVEDGDRAGLAAAIMRMLQEGELACRTAGRARAVVLERYALSRVVSQVEAIYHELVARQPAVVA
jgi:glycosyltransferase involved in cell wall biosynthesis